MTKMMEMRETKAIREALALADVVLASGNAVGEITGPAGTGKSVAGKLIAARYAGSLRVCAWEGMTRNQFLAQVGAGLGLTGTGVVERVLLPFDGSSNRRMLVVDEANKLGWRVLEAVRYLADECGFAVILIGTEMYSQKFTAARTQGLLVQLGSRIGAKRMSTRHLDRAEVYAHVIKPAFGEVTDKDLVTAFWMRCRKGNYREAVELSEECLRLMRMNEMQSLTPAVLELAGKWMANRYQ